MVTDNLLKEKLVQALEESFKESCAFVQSKPYLSEKEISGDLYTRLSRHLKLFNAKPLLSRDNIERTYIDSKYEIKFVAFQKLRYSNPSQNELVDLIRELLNLNIFNFEMYNLDAKLNKITFEVQSFKIIE